MIIDSHAYCFEPADSALGYESAEAHLASVQRSMARHHQPAFRIKDRQPGPSHVLDSGTGEKLPDLNFRIDKDAGRVLWDYDGDTYTKHFYPPNLRNLEFTTHSLIGEMDYAGIDKVLLHTNGMLGRSNEFQASCVKEYPDRILSMALVDEALIHTNVDAVITDLRKAIEDHGLHAIKFGSQGYQVSDAPWDGGPYQPFWDIVSTLGVPVFFTLGTGPSRGLEHGPDPMQMKGYTQELRILMRLMDRYPDMLCSITHGFPWRIYLNGDGFLLTDDIWEPFNNPNLSLEVCFPVRIGDLFDYPYREVWSSLTQMIERIGPAQLMYGTDMPFQNRFCTYRQSREWMENHFSRETDLSESDLALIMGGTAARVLGLS